jgi:hypothetical protein
MQHPSIFPCQPQKLKMKSTPFKLARVCKSVTMLTSILLILSLSGSTQIYKGQWLAGGDAAFSYYKYYTAKNSAFTLSPAAGYFFLNRLAGGVRFGYDAETTSYSSGSKSRERLIYIAPFLRYYFLSEEQKINLFADAGYGHLWGRFRNLNRPQDDFKFSNKVVTFKVGPAVFLNEHTSLEVSFGYTHSPVGRFDTLATNNFRIGVGFQIHLGKQRE